MKIKNVKCESTSRNFLTKTTKYEYFKTAESTVQTLTETKNQTNL